jgi:hypothetical protein
MIESMAQIKQGERMSRLPSFISHSGFALLNNSYDRTYFPLEEPWRQSISNIQTVIPPIKDRGRRTIRNYRAGALKVEAPKFLTNQEFDTRPIRLSIAIV